MNSLPKGSALVFIVALCACEKNSSTASPAVESLQPSGVAARLLNSVPIDAFAVVTIDSPEPFWELLLLGLPSDAEERTGLDADLRQLTMELVGVDVSNVNAAVGFLVGPEIQGAVLIPSVSGDMPGSPSGEYNGTPLRALANDGPPLVAARKGDVLIVGTSAAIEAALDTMAGKRNNLTHQDSPLGRWVAAACADGFFSLAATVDGLADGPKMMAVATGVERVCLRAGATGIKGVVEGDGDKLKGVLTQARAAMQTGMRELESQRARARMSGADPAEAVGIVAAYHYAKYYARTFMPTLSGNRLSVQMETGSGHTGAMTGVAAIGIAAAVAIPAFMKYIKKSKTSEARMLVKQIYDGSRRHYMEEAGRDRTTPPSFPKVGVGPTPPLGRCCAQGGKCEPDPSLWQHETWKALEFSVDDPHYYSYQYIPDSTGSVNFTARAMGDLDCDGVYSTYEMVGFIDAANSDGPSGEPSLYRENALE